MTSYICTHTYAILIEIFSNCQLLSFISVMLFDFMYERKRKKTYYYVQIIILAVYHSEVLFFIIILFYFIITD